MYLVMMKEDPVIWLSAINMAIKPVHNTRSCHPKSLDRKSKLTLIKERRGTMSLGRKLSLGSKCSRQKSIVDEVWEMPVGKLVGFLTRENWKTEAKETLATEEQKNPTKAREPRKSAQILSTHISDWNLNHWGITDSEQLTESQRSQLRQELVPNKSVTVQVQWK